MAGATIPVCVGRRPGISTRTAPRARAVRPIGVRDLNGFGCVDQPVAVAAAGCLLQYVKDTQRGACRI